MRIGLVSDSHRALDALARAVERMGPVDAILHAGDQVQDAETLRQWVSVPVWMVAGNWDAVTSDAPRLRLLDGFGPRVLLTHGHLYGVKHGTDELVQLARQHGAAVAVYGHTHRHQVAVVSGVLVVNPGSCAQPRGRQEATCGVLEVRADEGGWTVTASVFTLSGALVDWGEQRVARGTP